MNNHPSIHRNAKVFIKTVNCDQQFAFVHYQGIIASADNIGITIDGYSTSPLKTVFANANTSDEFNAEWKAHLKDQQQYGIYFLPWSNIAEVVVL
jgi:hypothetical protein